MTKINRNHLEEKDETIAKIFEEEYMSLFMSKPETFVTGCGKERFSEHVLAAVPPA